MTLAALVPDTGLTDPTLPFVVPDLGLAGFTHFYHPARFSDGGDEWLDEILGDAAIPLPVSGDSSINQESEGGFPTVRLTTTASFLPAEIFPAEEVGSIFVVAKIGATDGKGGTTGYLLHNGTSGLAHNTVGSTTISFTNGAPNGVATLDEYHLFSITTPLDTNITRFTIDGTLYTATGAASGDPSTLRLGGNNTTNHKQYTAIAAFATAEPLAAALITGTVFPAAKAWWDTLDWV